MGIKVFTPDGKIGEIISQRLNINTGKPEAYYLSIPGRTNTVCYSAESCTIIDQPQKG